MSLAKCERCGNYSIGSICERCRSQPDPNDLASLVRPIEAERDRLQTRIAELERQADELHARCLEAERQGMSTTLPAGLVARLEKRVESGEAALADASQRGDRWKEAAKKLRDERDAYKRAKEENDERYMIERDEARAECERWKAMKRATDADWDSAAKEQAEHIQRLEAGAARMREALKQINGIMNSSSDAESTGFVHAIGARALAETDAGTLALGCVEALRETGSLVGNIRRYVEYLNPALNQLIEALQERSAAALQAYDQATPHLKNTDISCDEGGETPGGSDGK